MQIGIIGLGNIGESLVSGLSTYNQYEFFIYDKNISKMKCHANTNYIFQQKSNEDVLKKCSIVILCIRGNQINKWIKEYKYLLKNKTLVSLQAGVQLKQLVDAMFPYKCHIVRIITNINIRQQKGHTVILNEGNNLNEIIHIFKYLGKIIEVTNEIELDKISLITGCTPAFAGEVLSELLITYDDSSNNIDLLKLLYEVMSSSLLIMSTEYDNPTSYTKKVCTRGGILEKCIHDLHTKDISNWLDPLKHTLRS